MSPGNVLVPVVVWMLAAGCGSSSEATDPFRGCESVPEGEPEVSIESLLEEMRSTSSLTRLPDPAYRALQSSSYDRRARTPEDPDGWFSNYDRGNFEREIEIDGRTEQVMLEAEGPGVVTRIWTATPIGTLRLYVDCATEPSFEASWRALGDGVIYPFQGPFGYSVTAVTEEERGTNLYFPIPYQERILITTDAGVDVGDDSTDMFYLVGYRSYVEGTRVESFSPERATGAREDYERSRQALTSPGSSRPGSPEAEGQVFVLDDANEGRHRLTAPEGGGVIRELRLVPSQGGMASLATSILSLSFDGRQTVRVPLADFFGAGPEPVPYQTLPMEVESDGTLVTRFAMPFERSAEVSVERPGGSELSLDGMALVAPRPFDDDSLYFHAGYRSHGPFPSELQDRELAALSGHGLYAGSALFVVNASRCWWGEGDERIYVDGEAFPSHFGTGTEDYYGYAWAMPETFARPFHAQPRYDAGQGTDECGFGEDLGGEAAMNRFHVPDPIPFEESLVFDMEVWSWANVGFTDSPMAFAAVTYWYARPGSEGGAELLEPAQDRIRSVADLR